MKENVHDIDKLFTDAISDHQESPSESVWDAIDQHLDKNKVLDINRKYIQLKRFAVVLLILLLGFGAYTLSTWTKTPETANPDNTKNIEQKNTSGTIVYTENKKDNISIANTADSGENHPIDQPKNSSGILTDEVSTAGKKIIPNAINGDEKYQNNQQQSTTTVLPGSVNKQDKIIKPAAINNIQKRELRELKNITGSLPSTVKKQHEIIAQAAIIAEKNNKIKSTDKILGGQRPNKKEEDRLGTTYVKRPVEDGTGSSIQKSKEIILASSGKKIIIDKRKQKNIVTNAGYAEVPNKIAWLGSVSNENESVEKPANLPMIIPEPINLRPDNSLKKFFLPDNYSLPDYLTFDALPPKASKIKKTGAFAATIFFAPNISFIHITDDKWEHRPGRPDDDDDRDNIRKTEKDQSSATFGMLIDYSFTKHWGLQSGIAVYNKTIFIDPKKIYADIDNSGNVKYRYNFSSGYLFLMSKSATNPVVGDSLQAFESTNTLQYIAVPLGIKYSYAFKKIDLFASVGASVNILTKGKIKTAIENGAAKQLCTSNKINGLKSAYFGGYAGIGAAYNITPHIALSFMPTFNFAITSGTKDARVKTYPYMISMAAGIRYKL